MLIWAEQGKFNQFYCIRTKVPPPLFKGNKTGLSLLKIIFLTVVTFLHSLFLNQQGRVWPISAAQHASSLGEKKSSTIPIKMPLAAPGIPAISETLFIRKYSSQCSVVKFVVWQKSSQSLEATVTLSFTTVLAQTSKCSLDRVLLPNMQILEGKHEHQSYWMGKWNPHLPTFILLYHVETSSCSTVLHPFSPSKGWLEHDKDYLFPLRARSIKLLF